MVELKLLRTGYRGGAPETVLSPLENLRSRDSQVRRRARVALIQQGTSALRDLVSLLSDPDERVRCEVTKALGAIANPSTTPDLVAALEDDSGEVRLLAAVGLVAIGPAALIPLLHVLHAHPASAPLREGAHHVLHQVTSLPLRMAVAPVIEALQGFEPETTVRAPIQRAMEQLRDLRP